MKFRLLIPLFIIHSASADLPDLYKKLQNLEETLTVLTRQISFFSGPISKEALEELKEQFEKAAINGERDIIANLLPSIKNVFTPDELGSLMVKITGAIKDEHFDIIRLLVENAEPRPNINKNEKVIHWFDQ